MNRAKVRWVWVGVSCLIFASAACRDREPSPRHNRNLGTAEKPLMPTPTVDAGPSLPDRTVEIPDRSNPAAVAQANAAAGSGDAAGPSTGGVISSFLDRLRGIAGQSPTAESPPDAEEE